METETSEHQNASFLNKTWTRVRVNVCSEPFHQSRKWLLLTCMGNADACGVSSTAKDTYREREITLNAILIIQCGMIKRNKEHLTVLFCAGGG